MLTILQQGGWILWLIVTAGIVGAVIFFERAFHLHRAKIRTDDFLKGIFNILRRRNITEALNICDETPGPVAFMVRSAIMHRDKGPETIRQAMKDAGLTEIARMERTFIFLATIAQVAPLLGLLGTVLGLIQAFLVIQQKSPLVHSGDLAGGVWRALLTAAAGLVVAILCYIWYNILVGKVNAIVLDMERACSETAGFFAGEEDADRDRVSGEERNSHDAAD